MRIIDSTELDPIIHAVSRLYCWDFCFSSVQSSPQTYGVSVLARTISLRALLPSWSRRLGHTGVLVIRALTFSTY